MKQLACRDAGFDCEAVVRGDSVDDVLAQAGPHAESVHGLEVTPQVREKLASAVKDA